MLCLAAQFLFFHVNDADLPASPLEWAWIIIGVSGTLVFGGRFFFQWIHSERHKESKIPISFWWMSIIATLMTGGYFLHRRQWVALLGNGPQLIPYTRNLILIYRKKREDERRAFEVLTVPAAVPTGEALEATDISPHHKPAPPRP